MKIISAIAIAYLSLAGLFVRHTPMPLGNITTEETTVETEAASVSDFEKAVEIIKKYESLHQPRHWPLVGYGHKVLPGEKFSRTRALTEKEADALLRKDLLKNCAVFRSYGADSLLLGVLAYNIGSGAALRSTVARKLKQGDRNIKENYIAHSRYRGKTHSQIQKRRIEEFDALFIESPHHGQSEALAHNHSKTGKQRAERNMGPALSHSGIKLRTTNTILAEALNNNLTNNHAF